MIFVLSPANNRNQDVNISVDGAPQSNYGAAQLGYNCVIKAIIL
jgi:hypothetical protein